MRMVAVFVCFVMLTCMGVSAAIYLSPAGDLLREVAKQDDTILPDPKDALICRSGGDARLPVGSLDAAIAQLRTAGVDQVVMDFSEAIRLEPSAEHYVARGLAWQVKQEYDRAIADYKEAARLGHPNAETHLRIVEALKQPRSQQAGRAQPD
jgi:tetratricopeptide (TPR) repeat protein